MDMEATDNTYTQLYVTANLLNGRSNPSKKSTVEARFDKGDVITATGKWSKDHHWIEVIGGETGTVWVYADYVNENDCEYIFAINSRFKSIKIRTKPFNGKITGYLKKGHPIKVYRVVLGWGKTTKGWIDMTLVEEY